MKNIIEKLFEKEAKFVVKVHQLQQKTHKQSRARLIHMTVIDDIDVLSKNYREYDSALQIQPKLNGKPYNGVLTEKVIHLVFLGNHMIPFSVLRPHTEGKENFYRTMLGKIALITTKENTNTYIKTKTGIEPLFLIKD